MSAAVIGTLVGVGVPFVWGVLWVGSTRFWDWYFQRLDRKRLAAKPPTVRPTLPAIDPYLFAAQQEVEEFLNPALKSKRLPLAMTAIGVTHWDPNVDLFIVDGLPYTLAELRRKYGLD